MASINWRGSGFSMWDYEEEIGRIKDEKLRPTVTYIQNGVERTLTLDGWNRWKVEDTIYAKKREYSPYYLRGTIKKDISWIHFKNFNFKFQADEYRNVSLDSEGWRNVSYGIMPECKILCPEDTVCILENCRFFGDEDLRRGECLSLIGGSFQVVHTYLGCFDSIYTRAVDFDLVAGNFTGGMKVTCRGGNVSIHDCDTITSLEVDSAKKLTLENNFRLKNFCMDGVSELVIGSEQVPTTRIISENSSSICSDNLVLNNCKLDFEGKLDIHYSVIDGKTYTLTGSELSVNGISYGKNAVLEDCPQSRTEAQKLLTTKLADRVEYLEIMIKKRAGISQNSPLSQARQQKSNLEFELAINRMMLEANRRFQHDEFRERALKEESLELVEKINSLNELIYKRYDAIDSSLLSSKPEKYLRRGK